MQSELRREFEKVVAVGDDLSFTLMLDQEIDQKFEEIKKFGKECKIYPFKKAVRFEKGFIAVEGKFIRISREIDRELLEKILKIVFSKLNYK
ncbi:MAG: hypothetical protein NZ895_03645 [Archaeoglobaceae archaeon]|nr:hypothetical protein [Archaeoglobaceae archaeon]MCX8152403.1 hypothetical protein [Archaeoglobaceae archaeon]MDW8013743.1 hypothetical protein [Archaeoglobaceae archaeon]